MDTLTDAILKQELAWIVGNTPKDMLVTHVSMDFMEIPDLAPIFLVDPAPALLLKVRIILLLRGARWIRTPGMSFASVKKVIQVSDFFLNW